MSSSLLFTEFAPAERLSGPEIVHDVAFFTDLSFVNELFDAVPNVFLILNQHRQIIFANKSTLNLLGISDASTLHGLRPGEALDCIHSDENTSGCGTTEACKTCGAVQAILSSLRGKETVQECRITQKNGNSLDLRVWATPLRNNGDLYSLFSVQDISHEKRRRVLERIFFHDIMNTAGGLQGVSELLQDASSDELDELKEMVYTLADRLVEEIQAQRLLSAAENDDITAHPAQIESRMLLREIINSYKNHEVAQHRLINLAPDATNVNFISDRTLLGRVISNLLKNALEASRPGDVVTLGCRLAGAESVEFWVHNPTFMPRNVQLQVFQRSFSTKGAGRGLGTYSIKLLTERYLKGEAWFTTAPESGTTFTVKYPRVLV